MKRLIVLLLLIPSVAFAQAFIARPADEDCSLASISTDGVVTVNWSCVGVYADKKDWQDETTHSIAVVLKAVRDGNAK